MKFLVRNPQTLESDTLRTTRNMPQSFLHPLFLKATSIPGGNVITTSGFSLARSMLPHPWSSLLRFSQSSAEQVGWVQATDLCSEDILKCQLEKMGH